MARTIKHIVWTEPMPDCDFCKMQGRQPIRRGIYDGPTVDGPWANMCTEHMRQHTPKNSSLISQRVRPKENDAQIPR